MFRGSKEYSLDELLEHPVLSVQITNEGIERRCLDLMLDAVSGHRRFGKPSMRSGGAINFRHTPHKQKPVALLT